MGNVSILLAGSILGTFAQANLLITGVVDGDLSGGLPKGVELYAMDNIADLSIYGIGAANNGGGSDGEEFTLSGSASAGDFLYISTATTEFQSVFGFAPTFEDFAVSINGDDAVELFMNGSVIDTYGDINTLGDGEVWDYTDSWAYRMDSSISASATFNDAEWTFGGAGSLDGMDAAAQGAAVPFGTYSPVPEPKVVGILIGMIGALTVVRRHLQK